MSRFSRSPLIGVIFAIGASFASASAQSENGSLCVAPYSVERPTTCAEGLCDSGPLSFKLDDRPVVSWPRVNSLKLVDLDTAAKHRVTVYRAGKPQQSFRFVYSSLKSMDACLFINDLYQDVQLWTAKSSPWCKCK